MTGVIQSRVKLWTVFGSVLLVSGMFQAVSAQTAVYKTVDDLGNVAYTDRPAIDMNQSIEVVAGLTTSVTDKSTLDAEKAKADEDDQYLQAANNIRETQSDEDAEFQAAVADQKDAACRAANARLSKYEKARRLYRERPDGEREYLNDTELDAERAEAVRAVDELCG